MSLLEEFDDIVRRTHVQIRAYIAGMGIASHEVDDLAQEVYLALYRGHDGVPAEVSPERWLKGIARNLCLNHIRRKSRRGRLQREALAELLAELESATDHASQSGHLDAALEGCYDRLPDDSKRLLKLRYRDDLPSHEIAATVESTAQAIRVALHRIRAGLKDCIMRKLASEGG